MTSWACPIESNNSSSIFLVSASMTILRNTLNFFGLANMAMQFLASRCRRLLNGCASMPGCHLFRLILMVGIETLNFASFATKSPVSELRISSVLLPLEIDRKTAHSIIHGRHDGPGALRVGMVPANKEKEDMDAIWGLIGALIGALASIATTWITTCNASTQQIASAEYARSEQNRAFQRETLLELQMAVSDLMRLVSRAQLGRPKGVSCWH